MMGRPIFEENKSAYHFIRNWLCILKPNDHIIFELADMNVKAQTIQTYIHQLNEKPGCPRYITRMEPTRVMVRRLRGGERD